MARSPKADPDATEPHSADDLIGELDALDTEQLGRLIQAAQERRAAKHEQDIATLKAYVRERTAALGTTPEELFGRASAPAATRAKASGPRKPTGSVAAQFRGPGGETWSGRGRSPRWLAALEAQGRHRDEFRIKSEPDLIETARREHEGKAA